MKEKIETNRAGENETDTAFSTEDNITDLQAAFLKASQNFIQYGKPSQNSITDDEFLLLASFGIDKEWYLNPVKLQGKNEVYCGEYNGELLTQEFYYTRLKAVMGEVTDC